MENEEKDESRLRVYCSAGFTYNWWKRSLWLETKRCNVNAWYSGGAKATADLDSRFLLSSLSSQDLNKESPCYMTGLYIIIDL